MEDLKRHNETPARRGKGHAGSRRNFLKRLWFFAGILTAIEFIWAFLSLLNIGKKKKSPGRTYTEIARVEDLPVNSVLPYRPGKLYLCHLEEDGFLALSLQCTHLGCAIRWDEGKKEFICPCHASRFNMKGEVLNPPATHPLDIMPIKIKNGMISVDLGTHIRRSSFRSNQVTRV